MKCELGVYMPAARSEPLSLYFSAAAFNIDYRDIGFDGLMVMIRLRPRRHDDYADIELIYLMPPMPPFSRRCLTHDEARLHHIDDIGDFAFIYTLKADTPDYIDAAYARAPSRRRADIYYRRDEIAEELIGPPSLRIFIHFAMPTLFLSTFVLFRWTHNTWLPFKRRRCCRRLI